MAIAGGGSGGVEAYEKKVRSKPSGGPQGGKGRTLSRGAIQTVMDASQYARDIGSPMQFSDLADQYKQYNVKYDRPAVFRESSGSTGVQTDEGLVFSGPGRTPEEFRAGTYYKDPSTGAERFFTAAPPTLGQLFGDIGRGLFSGYNTYIPQSQSTIGPYGLPVGPEGSVPISSGGFIQRQPGLVSKYLGSGGALGLIAGALKSIKEKL